MIDLTNKIYYFFSLWSPNFLFFWPAYYIFVNISIWSYILTPLKLNGWKYDVTTYHAYDNPVGQFGR